MDVRRDYGSGLQRAEKSSSIQRAASGAKAHIDSRQFMYELKLVPFKAQTALSKAGKICVETSGRRFHCNRDGENLCRGRDEGKVCAANEMEEGLS